MTAFEAMQHVRLAATQREIDRIVARKRARTVENTLAPYDEALQQLDAANHFSVFMRQVHPDTAIRDHATAMTTKVSGAATALALNQRVYRELVRPDVSKAEPATQYHVRRPLLEFRLADVDKDDATPAKLKKLQDRLIEDQSTFDRDVSDDVQSIEVAGEAPMRCRRLVPEPRGSMSANDLMRNVLGRAQDTKAFRRWMSEEFSR